MNENFDKELIDRVIENVRKQESENVICEICGANEVTVISYGLPGWIIMGDEITIDPRIKSLIEERRIVLGGCVKRADSPKYYCRKCRNKFGTLKENN